MADKAITQDSSSISWQAGIPLMGDKVVVRQLAMVIGIPLVCAFLLLVILQWPHSWERMGWLLQIMLGLTVFIVLLYAFVIVVFYGGKYKLRYTLDERGIAAQQTGRVVRLLPWVRAGLLLSGRPSAMGASVLAQTPGVQKVRWQDIDEIIPDDARRTLTLCKGKSELLVVHCNVENYGAVRQFCEERRGRGSTVNE